MVRMPHAIRAGMLGMIMPERNVPNRWTATRAPPARDVVDAVVNDVDAVGGDVEELDDVVFGAFGDCDDGFGLLEGAWDEDVCAKGLAGREPLFVLVNGHVVDGDD